MILVGVLSLILIAFPVSAIENPYQFTGKPLDSESGLYYYGARYYNPNIGRFTTPDVLRGGLANPLTLNRYTYVENNPLKYIDPTGNSEENFAKKFSRLKDYQKGRLTRRTLSRIDSLETRRSSITSDIDSVLFTEENERINSQLKKEYETLWYIDTQGGQKSGDSTLYYVGGVGSITKEEYIKWKLDPGFKPRAFLLNELKKFILENVKDDSKAAKFRLSDGLTPSKIKEYLAYLRYEYLSYQELTDEEKKKRQEEAKAKEEEGEKEKE